MKRFLLFFGLMAIIVSCSSGPAEQDVDVAKAKDLIGSGDVVILDVRTDEEYNAGHIKGAKHFDFYNQYFEDSLATLPKDQTYLVYCHSGGRSTRTCGKMMEKGFKKIYNLKGGWQAWSAAEDSSGN